MNRFGAIGHFTLFNQVVEAIGLGVVQESGRLSKIFCLDI